MWYEILPTYIIITTALAVPSIIVYFSNKLVLGQPYRRKLVTGADIHRYLRDARLSGNKDGYYYAGLDHLSDEDDKSS